MEKPFTDQEIKAALEKAVQNLGLPVGEIHLEHPAEEKYGDYASNIALQMYTNVHKSSQIANKEYKNPLELAEAIAQVLNSSIINHQSSIIDRAEVAGPGFINLWLKNDYLVSQVKQVLSSREEYGKSEILKGKRVLLEFGQPNTHKMPHIGHLFSYILGESLVRILAANGGSLFRANYQGDIGLHVAKCLWGFQKKTDKEEIKRKFGKSVEELDLKGKIDVLNWAYVKGSKWFEEDESAKEEILRINKSLYVRDDQELTQLWRQTRGWSVEFYKQFEKELGVHYDRYYFESEMYEKGMEIVKQAIGKIFTKSQGAIIFEGSKYGLHDRVFITKWGTPTYEAKDMALQAVKYDEWPFDLAIITTASEQNEYFKVVFKALEELDPKFKVKLKHIGFGMVSLKGMKMSSRKGKIVGAPELVRYTIQEAEDLAMERGISEEGQRRITIKPDHVGGLSERKAVSRQVGLGAIKYSFLKSRVGHDIVFNFGESISLEGDSGPYLQYTYARTQSVLRKAGLSEEGRTLTRVRPLSCNKEELAILRWLYRFPEVVKQAGQEYAPHVIANYLYELAGRFNLFYNKHRILEGKNQKSKIKNTRKKSKDLAFSFQTSAFRLLLTAATGQILKNGLNLLGIPTPEKM